MPNMVDNLDEFINALKNNTPIECNLNGQWTPERICHKFTRYLTLNYYDKNHLVTIAKAFIRLLDENEKIPVIFHNDLKVIQPQFKKFLHYLNAFDVIQNKFESIDNQQLKLALNIIKQRIIGLKYRIESIHGGIDKKLDINETLFKYICHLAEQWKLSQRLCPTHLKQLTTQELARLREACLYPEFIRLLSGDKILQKQFFAWILRDNNGASQFIEFPATCLRLHACTLSKRIGRLAPNELNIVNENLPYGYQKILCLPFYIHHQIKRMNILDDSNFVTLNDSLHITINDIFKSFSNKKTTPGNIEFFGTTGIMNWSNFEFGAWNPKSGTYNRIDFSLPNWWKQLPILEELSKQDLEKRYQISINDGEWVRCLSSTREALDYNVMGTHGYIEMAIPLDNNRYALYPFGKFPKHYPTYRLPQLRLVTQTVEARIAYPDENTFYSHRQRATNPKTKTPEEGKAIMARIRRDIIRAINGNLSFQLGYENCAHWAEETITSEEGKEAPIPFKMPIVNMQPSHKAINFLLQTKPVIQSAILHTFHLFASHDGKKIKEDKKIIYKTTQFPSKIEQLYQYQPALLNKQIEEGKLPGVISYGNYSR